jgi:hypothetical protein
MWDARLVKVKTVIEYCIVHAHSLTSAYNTTVYRTVQVQNNTTVDRTVQVQKNTTVDRTVQVQNRNCLCVPDVMSLLHICSQEDINHQHNMLEGCEN